MSINHSHSNDLFACYDVINYACNTMRVTRGKQILGDSVCCKTKRSRLHYVKNNSENARGVINLRKVQMLQYKGDINWYYWITNEVRKSYQVVTGSIGLVKNLGSKFAEE